VSVLARRPATTQRPRRAAQGRSASGPGSDPGRLRLRDVRRAEPDVLKLVEWVLNITQARYDAYRAGQPDPYGLAPPDELATDSQDDNAGGQRTMEPEALHQRRSTA
jgi:hypothetical protein